MSSDLQSAVSRKSLSPLEPQAVIDEHEADGTGGSKTVTTVLLTASECPIGCNMCDLWRNTLTVQTPAGAIPRQIDFALAGRRQADWVKLYNSGNFFDPNSIPPDDYAAIAKRCASFSRVIVENHPRFGADRLQRFRDLLDAQLEVAVGLETVQPRWLHRMGKRMGRGDFDRYAKWLRDQGVDLRVFLIVGVPGVTVDEAIRWARLSVRHAIANGARHISLIPARAGHGWNGSSAELPALALRDLIRVQQVVLDDSQSRAVITIDLWDAKQLAVTNEQRILLRQLEETNLTNRVATA